MDYKEKIRLAKEALDSGSYDKETIEYIFPELKESEDERIRKELIAMVRLSCTNSDDADKKIAWLEKQGEKPAWSEEDDTMIDNILGTYKTLEDMLDLTTSQDRDILESMNFERNWLKSLKDRYTWRPSDEQMDALRYVTNFDYGGHKATLVSLYEQLKKLKR